MIRFAPKTVIHPGRILQNHLEGFGVSQKWLAEHSGLTEKLISSIINEKASISTETAEHLAAVFDDPLEFWLNVEANYQADLAQANLARFAKSEIVKLDKKTYKILAKEGLVENTNNETIMVINLYNYFGINSLDLALSSQKVVAFRQSGNTRKTNPFLVAAWLRQGEKKALEFSEIETYDRHKLFEAVGILRALTFKEPKIAFKEASALLAECGVVLSLVKFLPCTYVNGATRWIGAKPVIQLSDRSKQEDIVWFTLFHEIGHMLLHSKKEQFIEYNDGKKDDKENEADDFAERMILRQKDYEDFLAEHPGHIRKEDIVDFSKRVGIAPSLIVGRLCRNGEIRYGQFSDLNRNVSFSEI